MRKYRLVAKKGEGTFSEVLKAQNVKDGRYHAIKCMKNRFESIDQVNNLREIQALRRLSPHEHIITLEEVLYDQPTGRLALVFELMDANLYELIRGRRHYLNPNLIKSYMWQLMKSLDHMHRKGIFHRDIKPENILIENCTDVGRGLKLADFGSCRGIYSKQPYTEYISTRWYRAPECLLTDGYYGPEMDMWGAGCVMFEITSLYPLYPGSNEVDQISRIHKVLGTPSQEILQKFRSKGASHISFDFPPQKGIGIPQLVPHAGVDAIDLMVKLIKYDASERISAREAMRHPYFRDVREAESQKTSDVQKAAPVAGNHGAGEPGTPGRNSKPAPGAADQTATGGKSSAGAPIGGKALPSLVSGAGGSNTDGNAQRVLGLPPQVKQSLSEASNSHVPMNLQAGTQSILPPIANAQQGQTQASVHNKVGGAVDPKKKKKYKVGATGGLQAQVQSAGQSNEQQVQPQAQSGLRAYGMGKTGGATGMPLKQYRG